VKLSVLKRSLLVQVVDLSQEVLAHDHSETIFLIGRSKECHVVLDDKQISREHSRIIRRHNRWMIEKISEDSSELLLNGERISFSELKINDIVTIGQFQIRFDDLGEIEEIQSEHIPVVKEEPVKASFSIQDSEKESIPVKSATPVAFSVVESDSGDVTREIDASELTKEIDLNNIATDKDSFSIDSSDDEVSSDNSKNQEEASDDFNFDDQPGESFTESPEVAIDNQGEALVETGIDDNAYSLENIDSGDGNDGTVVMQTFSAVHLELFGDTAPYDKYIVDKNKVYIGRDPAKCQIVLNDPEVSSVHALITKNNITLSIEDLNSGNGTLLNGKRVNK
jgi:pSer/pThr/pTyr-binding forkhead associated (FHA) protein